MYHTSYCGFWFATTNCRSIFDLTAHRLNSMHGFWGLYESSEKDFLVIRSTQTQDPRVCDSSKWSQVDIYVLSMDGGKMFWVFIDRTEEIVGQSLWTSKSYWNIEKENRDEFGKNLAKLFLMFHGFKFEGIPSDRHLEDINQKCQPVKNCLIFYCVHPIKGLVVYEPYDFNCFDSFNYNRESLYYRSKRKSWLEFL